MNVNLLRWVLIIPVAVLAWLAVFFAGVMTLQFAKGFCPEEMIVSGMCIAGWWSYAEQLIIYTFSGLSAAAVIISSTLTAPSNKNLVTVLSFVIGGIAALLMTIDIDAWPEFSAAITVGFLTMVWLTRMERFSGGKWKAQKIQDYTG